MKDDVLDRLVAISLRTRLLQTFHAATKLKAGAAMVSEREILAMEAIRGLKKITEQGLCQLFGMSPSSVSDMVTRLTEQNLVTKPEKTRGKPLSLTKGGQEVLVKMRQATAQRFDYLFEGFTDQDWEVLLPLLERVGGNAQRYLEKELFADLAMF